MNSDITSQHFKVDAKTHRTQLLNSAQTQTLVKIYNKRVRKRKRVISFVSVRLCVCVCVCLKERERESI